MNHSFIIPLIKRVEILSMTLLACFLQLLPVIILIAYGYWKKNARPYLIMLAMLLPAVVLYPFLIRIYLIPAGFGSWNYFFMKLVLFVVPGFLLIRHFRLGWKSFGMTMERMKYSIGLGLLMLLATALFNSVLWTSAAAIDLSFFLVFALPMFLDAFSEEFLFRGAYFMFAWKRGTNVWLAFIASTLLTIAWHPLEPVRMIPAVFQGSLFCLLLYKTQNLTGAWVSHGLNRSVVQLLSRVI